MSIYELKPWFRKQLSGVTYTLWRQHITPNQITLCAVFLSIFYGIGMLSTDIFFLFFPLFVLLRMALNAIDGLMANNFNLKSDIGMKLNEGGDIVSDIALFLPFMLYINPYLVLSFIALSLITETVGMWGKKISFERHYHGPMGKSDRVFILSFISLLVYFMGYLPYEFIVFSILNLLLIKTIYNRWSANYV